MARPKMKICSVTGMNSNEKNFYSNQNHLKDVDNLRRKSNATKDQLQTMFHQINNY